MQAHFVHDGKAIDYTPDSDIAAGQVVVMGSLVGIAKIDIPAGRTGALHTVGVYDIAKETGAIGAGGKVFWDADGDPAGGVENSGAAKAAAGAGNVFMGFAVAAAAETDETVRVLMIGSDDLGDIPVAAVVSAAGALTASDPDACAAITATLTGVDTDTDMTAAQAATIVTDLGALKAGIDSNNVAIDAAIDDLGTLRTAVNAILTSLKNAGLMASE